MVSLLDIIGPVMVGPSSSHTAGACRLGLLARCLVGGTPDRARIELHGSFARTGEGHGTDKAIVGGLMGFRPDDERIRDALGIAEREGLDYRFEKTTLGEENEVHPNTVRVTIERGDRSSVMVGSSLGAGRVLVTEIDGYPVEVTGNYHTIVLVAEDVPGSVARTFSESKPRNPTTRPRSGRGWPNSSTNWWKANMTSEVWPSSRLPFVGSRGQCMCECCTQTRRSIAAP